MPTKEVSMTLWKRRLYATTTIGSLKERCPDENSFYKEFSSDKQISYVKDVYGCFLGAYPTLAQVNETYEKDVAQKWLVKQLKDLCHYLGYEKTLDIAQMTELPDHIYMRFHWLKVSEVMLFLWLFKEEEFCEHFGKVEPAKIVSALQDFVGEEGYRTKKIEEIMSALEEKYENWHSQNVVNSRDFQNEFKGLLEAKAAKVESKESNTKGEGNDEVLNSALALVNNTHRFESSVLEEMCKAWAKRYKCTPQEYVSNHKTKEE